MTFIQFQRESKEFDALIKKRPSAFLLLTIIAKRARRTNDSNFDGLEIGEALIGDYKTYGATEQIYRSDKELLKSRGFVTIKTTNKGTIAKIVNTSIFNINAEEITTQPTGKQRTTNEQATTNNNDKNDKKERAEFFDAWNEHSPTYLKSLSISDPAFIERARQAFIGKAKAATENAVKIFINNQIKFTPPDMAEYKSDLWEGVNE